MSRRIACKFHWGAPIWISISSRIRACAAFWAWRVPKLPGWPVARARRKSFASEPRISPITMRSGRSRSVRLTNWHWSMAGRIPCGSSRVNKRRLAWFGMWISGVSSMIRSRSSDGKWLRNEFSTEVLPAPVVPTIRKLLFSSQIFFKKEMSDSLHHWLCNSRSKFHGFFGCRLSVSETPEPVISSPTTLKRKLPNWPSAQGCSLVIKVCEAWQRRSIKFR